MIIVGPRAIAGDFLGDLARAEELARDLACISDGYRPGPRDLARIPILENWALGQRRLPCLLGMPGDGPLSGLPNPIASVVCVHAPELGWARTLSGFWRLGSPRETRRTP